MQAKFINLGGLPSRILKPCMTYSSIITVLLWPDLLHVSLGYHCRSDPVQVQSWLFASTPSLPNHFGNTKCWCKKKLHHVCCLMHSTYSPWLVCMHRVLVSVWAALVAPHLSVHYKQQAYNCNNHWCQSYKLKVLQSKVIQKQCCFNAECSRVFIAVKCVLLAK